MRSEHLPIFKATLDLCVYLDGIVKNQEKYHKYSIGSEMRVASRQMLYLLNRANVSQKEKRVALLEQLIEHEAQQRKMAPSEIKEFLSVKASFASHAKHANSYNLLNKVGTIDESNPFDYTRA